MWLLSGIPRLECDCGSKDSFEKTFVSESEIEEPIVKTAIQDRELFRFSERRLGRRNL
jgi:hypothetical protein